MYDDSSFRSVLTCDDDEYFDDDKLDVDDENLFADNKSDADDRFLRSNVSSSTVVAVVFPVRSAGASRAENDPKSLDGSILFETFLSLMLALITGKWFSSGFLICYEISMARLRQQDGT